MHIYVVPSFTTPTAANHLARGEAHFCGRSVSAIGDGAVLALVALGDSAGAVVAVKLNGDHLGSLGKLVGQFARHAESGCDVVLQTGAAGFIPAGQQSDGIALHQFGDVLPHAGGPFSARVGVDLCGVDHTEAQAAQTLCCGMESREVEFRVSGHGAGNVNAEHLNPLEERARADAELQAWLKLVWRNAAKSARLDAGAQPWG